VAVLICADQGASCKEAKYETILEGRGRGQASREGHVGAGGQVCESDGVEKDARDLGGGNELVGVNLRCELSISKNINVLYN